MPRRGRNAEVIRQWGLLLHLDAHRAGVDVYDLARHFDVTRRTIWRDLQALQEVGFPLRDEKRDRRTYWLLAREPLRALGSAGLSWSEVCSLYVSQALLLSLTGTPFERGMRSVVAKVEKALSPQMKRFLGDLPGVVHVKAAPRKRVEAERYPEVVARVIEACQRRHVATMRYFSAHRAREKQYLVHPYQVGYHDGGLYLSAFVPEYGALRTFAIERIRAFVVDRRTFEATDVSGNAFGHSLGVSQGSPERIVIDFGPRVAKYVAERQWHASQQLAPLPDGGVRCCLRVCRDYALEQWVLSWGPHAKVVSPSVLAEQILSRLEEARLVYAPRLDFEPPTVAGRPAGQPRMRL
ncbi:MAG: transcriptional regulator [Acidobacteriota bacterium]